jgi:pyruvate dehydrogenase complex dehydrogenase (E1) component
MKFKKDQFWWTRDGERLIRIVNVNPDQDFDPIRAQDIGINREFYFQRDGKFSKLTKSAADLIKQETDPKVILKYLLKEKE